MMTDDTRTSQYEELKEIIFRTLEKKGILAKAQAQLRKNVFEALNEQENIDYNEIHKPNVNEDDYDRLVLGLITEYLSFHQLDYTLNLFQTECSLKSNFRSMSRGEIASKLGIGTQKPEPTQPLLKQIVNKLYDKNPFQPRNSNFDSNNNKLKPRISNDINKQIANINLLQDLTNQSNPNNNTTNNNNDMSGMFSSTKPRNKKPQPQPSTQQQSISQSQSQTNSNDINTTTNNNNDSIELSNELNNVNNQIQNMDINMDNNENENENENDNDNDNDNDNLFTLTNSGLSSLGGLPPLNKGNRLPSMNNNNSLTNPLSSNIDPLSNLLQSDSDDNDEEMEKLENLDATLKKIEQRDLQLKQQATELTQGLLLNKQNINQTDINDNNINNINNIIQSQSKSQSISNINSNSNSNDSNTNNSNNSKLDDEYDDDFGSDDDDDDIAEETDDLNGSELSESSTDNPYAVK